ncbi:hypothetical protein M434DRAFT_36086 [Hypoxylon sp. CO27-5]|nr:hypothetical protein M434DRAFT_36086 [Hypoxylon sp. CO27-5]
MQALGPPLQKIPSLLQFHPYRKILDKLRARFRTTSHEDPGSDSEGNLCKACASLDITAIVRDTHWTPESRLIFNLRNEHLQLKRSSCPLCDIIIWMLQGIPSSISRDGLALVITPGRHRFGHKWERTELLTLSTWAEIKDDGEDVGCRFAAIEYSQSLPQTNPSMKSRRLRPYEILEYVDYKRITQWLSYCNDMPRHSICKPPIGQRKWPTKLLDCQTLEIVTAQPSDAYVALSYVWGKQQDNTSSIQDCPATIRDAIEVTIKIGYRYLWVDRYCINQHHSAEKYTEIQQMGRIYNGASLTIVAAAGSGPDHGLPGVSKPRKQRPPTKTLSEWTITGFPDDPHHLITSSVWMSRAWTYQEALLSRRRLYFTDQVLYFECQKNIQEESYVDMDGDGHAFFLNGKLPGYQAYGILRYISDYSRRRSTYENDYLNAFLGVLGYMAEAKPPIFHLCGVPILSGIRPDEQQYLPMPIERDYVAELMIGMSWIVINSERRRDSGLPSWSWVGWKGPVKWAREWTHVKYIYPFTGTKAWVENANLELLPVQALCEQSNPSIGDYSLCKVIHIESLTFEVTLTHFSPGSSGYLFRRGHHRSVLMGEGPHAVWEVDNNVRVYARVNVFGAISQTQRFKVLSLGKNGGRSMTIGKLLRKIPGGYEVVGHIRVDPWYLYIRSLEGIQGVYDEERLMPRMVMERVRLL